MTDTASTQTADASALAVFCPGAVQSLVRPLLEEHAAVSGQPVAFQSLTAGAIVERIAAGASGDVVIATNDGLMALADRGTIDRASLRELGTIGLGIAVRRGAPAPRVIDVDSFKQALLAARSIMYADPAHGGQSGIHIDKVLKEIGIAEALSAKLELRPRGPDGFKEVARGEIDIGLGPVSEILAHKELELIAPFPDAIQGAVTFAAAIHASSADKRAAADAIDALVSPAARANFQAAGFITG